jgi:hypothetical protein
VAPTAVAALLAVGYRRLTRPAPVA